MSEKKIVPVTYEEAVARIDEICREMSSDNVQIDKLMERVAEARELISFCRARIAGVEEDSERMLADMREI